MEKREKKKLNMKKQWAKFIIVMVCYLLFLYWVKSWLGLLVVPFIYDAYISKKINWKWWQDCHGLTLSYLHWWPFISLTSSSSRTTSFLLPHWRSLC